MRANSWRATVEELRKRDYRKDLCLVAEYTDDATEGSTWATPYCRTCATTAPTSAT